MATRRPIIHTCNFETDNDELISTSFVFKLYECVTDRLLSAINLAAVAWNVTEIIIIEILCSFNLVFTKQHVPGEKLQTHTLLSHSVIQVRHDAAFIAYFILESLLWWVDPCSVHGSFSKFLDTDGAELELTINKKTSRNKTIEMSQLHEKQKGRQTLHVQSESHSGLYEIGEILPKCPIFISHTISF